MGKKPNEPEPYTRRGLLILLFMGLVSCTAVFVFTSSVLRPPRSSPASYSEAEPIGHKSEEESGCCRGIENLELWGSAVKWGSDFKLNSSEECCNACKAMCDGGDGPCLCDTWVFCGNKEACRDKYGECWLKKQKDVLSPDKQKAGNSVMWTSGLIFGRGEGIVGFATEHGTIRIKLLPDCSPRSVAYILELLQLRLCAGCHFYRAETRGLSWDVNGDHIKDASFGPPFAIIQGNLGAQGTVFEEISRENCPTVERGSVAWVGSGPEFFISLANHKEWRNSYTVFGSVLPEDMDVVEKIAGLPTKADVWSGVSVSPLEKIVPLRVERAEP